MNTMLHKLYEKMSASDPCFMFTGHEVGNILRKDFDRVFTIAPHLMLDFASRFIQTFMRTDTYIELSLELHQTIRTYVVGKNMKEEKRKYIEKCVQMLTEFGFSKKMHQDEPPIYFDIKLEKRGGEDGFMHYNGLQEYIAENTKIEGLQFNKLDYLFRIYLIWVSAILLVNLVHYAYEWSKTENNYLICFNQIIKRTIRISLVQTKHKLTAFIGTGIRYFQRRN